MKKMIFETMDQVKAMMVILEQFNFEYSWYFLNKKYEIHLGPTKWEQVKYILKNIGCTIPFKWGDYYW